MTLLCIDDDPEDIELFQEAIRIIDDSTRCIVATNGLEGLHVLNNTTPDCIFLDINMPIMDGKETLKHIRNDGRFDSIPIFIFSTSSSKKEAEACRILGATQCLIKPGSFIELITELRLVFSKM